MECLVGKNCKNLGLISDRPRWFNFIPKTLSPILSPTHVAKFLGLVGQTIVEPQRGSLEAFWTFPDLSRTIFQQKRKLQQNPDCGYFFGANWCQES